MLSKVSVVIVPSPVAKMEEAGASVSLLQSYPSSRPRSHSHVSGEHLHRTPQHCWSLYLPSRLKEGSGIGER